MHAKPFIKWVGGKTQLLDEIERKLPTDFAERKNLTYIEPFVGGGAALFWILQKFPNIENAVICDINKDLMTTYRVIKNQPEKLSAFLQKIQNSYLSLDDEKRKEFYLEKRNRFNKKECDEIENSAIFIFLNRTCFNGLYRVNRKGEFNVPFTAMPIRKFATKQPFYSIANCCKK